MLEHDLGKQPEYPLMVRNVCIQQEYLTPVGNLVADGITRDSAGSVGISMIRVSIPPGGRDLAHSHPHETTIYVLRGRARTYFGDQLQFHVDSEDGNFIYIPPSIPHKGVNLSLEKACEAIVSRADSNPKEEVIFFPELDNLVDN